MVKLIRYAAQAIIVAAILAVNCVSVVGAASDAASDCAANPSATGCPCAENSSAAICSDLEKTGGNANSSLADMATNYIKVALFIAGVLAVLAIIYAGISYVTAGGETAKITKAQTILLYAVIGLVVSICAYAIVDFVVGKFK